MSTRGEGRRSRSRVVGDDVDVVGWMEWERENEGDWKEKEELKSVTSTHPLDVCEVRAYLGHLRSNVGCFVSDILFLLLYTVMVHSQQQRPTAILAHPWPSLIVVAAVHGRYAPTPCPCGWPGGAQPWNRKFALFVCENTVHADSVRIIAFCFVLLFPKVLSSYFQITPLYFKDEKTQLFSTLLQHHVCVYRSNHTRVRPVAASPPGSRPLPAPGQTA